MSASDPPLVDVRGVTKRFSAGGLLRRPERDVVAVDEVSFTMARGESVCVVGESGSGKTTLARMLTLLERPTGGSIAFDGRDVAAISGADLRLFRRRVQMVFQNPYDSLDPRWSIADILDEPLRVHGLGRDHAERRRRIEEALDQVELRPPGGFLGRYPHQLSGGQRQRVAIARSIIVNPELLVADEPISMLDVSLKAGVVHVLDRIRRATGQAQFIVTHDLSTARYLADRTLIMFRGRLLEEGPTATLLEAPFHPYTRALIAAVPRFRRHKAAAVDRTPDVDWRSCDPAACAMQERCGERLAHQGAIRRRYLQVGPGHVVACCRLAAEAAGGGATKAALIPIGNSGPAACRKTKRAALR